MATTRLTLEAQHRLLYACWDVRCGNARTLTSWLNVSVKAQMTRRAAHLCCCPLPLLPHPASSSRYDPEQRMTANEALNHPFFRLPLAPSAPALPHTSSASLPPVGSEPSSEA